MSLFLRAKRWLWRGSQREGNSFLWFGIVFKSRMEQALFGRSLKPGVKTGSNDSSPVTPANLETQTRLRAYQRYEERGRQYGFAEQDVRRPEGISRSSNVLKAVA